jgi:Protein of unknown function DUF262
MSKANLDALIPREDFDIDSETTSSQSLGDRLKVSELLKGEGFFYSALRKPDFQRETSDWDKEKIASFVKSFIDGDLIPSIILWQAGQYIFVIDGAHRLSALIAWVNDDYGDGFISQSFFNHDIESEQKRIAEQTEKHVNKTVGSYKDYMDAIRDPNNANKDKLSIANKLGYISLQLQWVTGSAAKAESSFFTINQKATPISETEISILKARKKPHAMASRAILRSGGGHKYWKEFKSTTQDTIQTLAKELNGNLFTPEIKKPIKTLDLPLAGKGYSSNSMSLIFELVCLANNTVSKSIQDDLDGSETIAYLTNTNKIIRRLTTTHQSSLGLHPAVYFYSEKGRYQPTAFMAWVEIIKEFDQQHSKFIEFSKKRELLEKYLIQNKHLTNQVTLKYGSGLKGFKPLKELYLLIIESISTNNVEMKSTLKKEYPYLNFDYFGDTSTNPDFNANTKSEIFITTALETATKCALCNGYIHMNSISIDHIQRKQDGGVGNRDNGQISHPFCNSTLKN